VGASGRRATERSLRLQAHLDPKLHRHYHSMSHSTLVNQQALPSVAFITSPPVNRPT